MPHVNDAERLSQDPTFRLIGSEKVWERGAALTSRSQTFETEMLAEEANSGSLTRVNREPIGKAEALDSPQRAVLDIVVGGGLSTPRPGALPKQPLMISVNSLTDPAQAAKQASHFGESC